jgi:YVTN family beta-propeller protein
MSRDTGRYRLRRCVHGTGPSKLLAIGFGLILPACGGDSPVDPGQLVESITVTAVSMADLEAIDATVQLEATARNAGGDPVSGVAFEWISNNEALATVDENGLVTAVSNGSATITASANGASGSISVAIEQVATDLVFASSPANGSVDEPLGTIEVHLLDANGHVAENFTGSVEIAIGENPRAGSLGGQLTSAAGAGAATFAGLSLDEAGAGYTLVATVGTVSGESDAFNVTRPSLYVGDYGPAASAVTVVDLATGSVLETITVGTGPAGIAITPDGLFAYVANRFGNSVSVIETPGNTVVQTIPMDDPELARMSPDGKMVYVANFSVGRVSVIETATNTVVETIPVGSGPYGVGFSPAGDFAYVANGNSESVSVIETATSSVVATVTVGQGPTDVVVTPDGEKVYVTNATDNNVSVISTASNTVIATIPLGDNTSLATVTPDGSAVFVANFGSDNVSRIETANDVVSATIPVGDGPFAVVAGPDGELVYAANVNAGTISVIDVATNTVTATITVGGRAGDLAVMPAPTR